MSPTAREAPLRRGLPGSRCGRWRAQISIRSGPKGPGQLQARARPTARWRNLCCGSFRLEQVRQVFDDHVRTMLAQGGRLSHPVDADDEAETAGPARLETRQGVLVNR